jgi:RNA polymerase sigma-70 factor (ECF subfamily)
MPVKTPDVTMLIATDPRPGFGTLTATRTEAPTDEAALVEAVKRNAPGSREAIYHRYKRRVFALAARIAGPGEAEEVVQEAFIRVFRGLPRFRGDSALGTWIYRLAVNAALSHRARRPPIAESLDQRQHGGGRLAHQGHGHDAAGDDGWLEPQAHGAGALGPGGDAVLRRRLERGLASLPVGYRTVIVLHDIEGLEHEEIAEVLGCHVGTSKSQLHKARARLRDILSAEGVTAAAELGARGGGTR